MSDKAEKKVLSNNEFNEKVFDDIKKHEDKIKVLKETLKPVEEIKNASLAECNAIAKKNKTAIIESRKGK